MEELLDQAQVALAPDKRRFQTLRLERARAACRHTQRPKEKDSFGLPFEFEGASIRVGDRRLRHPPGRFPDEHGSGLGGGLYARGSVDEIASDHTLALGTEGHRRLSSQD